MLGRKKVALLIVALFSICSCVDDMYDLSKKELSLDMKIEDKPAEWGNHGEYRLMDTGSNNFFHVKTETIKKMK